MSATETVRAHETSVEAVVKRMRLRADAPLNLAEMANVAGVSRCHFDRVFRGVTGLTPRQFQTALRLQSAMRLLLTTNRSVTDVCYDVGYESLGSFVTKFTQTFGLPPQRLRELGTQLDRPWSEWLVADILARFDRDTRPPRISGTVRATTTFEGLIFIGLFVEPMPIGAPVACAVLTSTGPFIIGSAPRSAPFVLAVGIPWSEKPLAFLLSENTLRGAAKAETDGVDVLLRPPRPLDPPINLALPFLLNIIPLSNPREARRRLARVRSPRATTSPARGLHGGVRT